MKNDGTWHASAKSVRRGAVQRCDPTTGRWEVHYCPHQHRKQSAALRCAQQAAARWNRDPSTAPGAA